MEMRQDTKERYQKFFQVLTEIGDHPFSIAAIIQSHKIDASMGTFLIKSGYFTKDKNNTSLVIRNKRDFLSETVLEEFRKYKTILNQESKRKRDILSTYASPEEVAKSTGFISIEESDSKIRAITEAADKRVKDAVTDALMNVAKEAAEAAEWAVKHGKTDIAKVVFAMLNA